MLKAPPLKSPDLHFLLIKCNCRLFDDNIGPKLKKLSFPIFGANNMFGNRFNQYRTKVCPEIGICRVYDEVFFNVMASGGLYSLIYINNSQS